MRLANALPALLAVLPLPAQETVKVASCLDPVATRAAAQWLRGELAGLRVEVVARPEPDLVAALRGQRADAAVVLGLDADLAWQLAAERVLASHAPATAADLGPAWRGPEDRYLVPLVEPWALVTVRAAWPDGQTPHQVEDLLFEPRFRGHVVVVEPAAAPSLWLGWVRDQLGHGEGEEHVVAWLRTLDVAVEEYAGSVSDAVARLADGRASIGLLPLGQAEARRGELGLRVDVPAAGVPGRGAAMALVEGRASAPARRVLDRLVSVEFARAMLARNLLPVPRPGLAPADLPPPSRSRWERLLPHARSPIDRGHWLALWRDEVRGTGSVYAWLDLAFDGVFTIGFLVFVFFAYRSLQRHEAPAGGRRS